MDNTNTLNISRVLSIPNAKCLFAHEIINDGCLDFVIDVALEALSMGVDHDNISVLAGQSKGHVNYFELRGMVRRFIECLQIVPVSGSDALGLYVLCKLELYIDGKITKNECIQFLAEIGKDPDWRRFHLLDEIIVCNDLRWSEDSAEVIAGWRTFEKEVVRLKDALSISINVSEGGGMYKLAVNGVSTEWC